MAALRLVARKLVERPLPRVISLSHGGTAATSLRRLSSSTESSEVAALSRQMNAKREELEHLDRRLEHLRATGLSATDMERAHRDMQDVFEQTRRQPRITDLFLVLGLGAAVGLLLEKARRMLTD